MKQWIGRITWALLAYLVFLIATIPAHLITPQLPKVKNLQLGNVSGTIWQGQMDMLQYDKVLLKDVKWQISFLSLLTGKVSADIEFGHPRKLLEPQGSLVAQAGFSSAVLKDIKVKLPADLIAQQVNIPFPVVASGLVEANLPVVEAGKPVCGQLDGTINWRMASVEAMNNRFNYGDITAKLSCDNGAAQALVSGNKDILEIDLKGRLNTMKNYAIGGYVALGPKADKALQGAIQFLGNPDSEGRYQIKFSQ
ncbi:type II secretion system protein N [Catenovulum sp. SX2]|uniref:type II secretion system protein N n=1 Tax=Catenovulum TaxID=1172191 RepID=UPI0002ED5761|nr:type II secretion system protein N [Catenovulum agarivorans]